MQVRYNNRKRLLRLTRITGILMPITLLLHLVVLTVNAENLTYTHAPIINIGVYPTWQAYSGENITIRVKVEALEDLRDIDICIYAYGSKNEGYDSWSKYLSIMNDTDLSSGAVRDNNYTLAIPSDASPGLVYAIIYIHYKYWSNEWHEYATDIAFQMTYLKNKAYEDLQRNYINLLNEYNNYRQSHGYLDSSILRALIVNLDLNRNLNYLFVTTPIILIVVASYLALKKSKVREKASETFQQGPGKSIHRMKSQISRSVREKKEKSLIQHAQEILKYS